MCISPPRRAVFTVALVGLWVASVPGCGPKIEESAGPERVAEPSARPLPSWLEGEARQAILDFVAEVADPDGPRFVTPADRIAVFDNDGTLWSEQPLYFQGIFAFDEVRRRAADHPEWVDLHPYSVVLSDDPEQIGTLTEADFFQILAVSHAGVTVRQFQERVRDWLATARHPRFEVPYTEMVFQPMLELLDYLRAHDFQTFIVSGGGVEMIRQFAEEVYGIPPDQVVGSSLEQVFEIRDGQPVIVRLPELHFLNDKAGKPVGINRFIGKRPILAFGNSDGDLQMLQYTAAGEGPSFMGIVHHDDAEREWAYDRESHLGRLDAALDEANERGWTVVSMKDDWRKIYPFPE